MASLSKVVSTLGLIRFIRQDFGVAVRFNFWPCPDRAGRLKPVRALARNTVLLQWFRAVSRYLRLLAARSGIDCTVYAGGDGAGLERRKQVRALAGRGVGCH